MLKTLSMVITNLSGEKIIYPQQKLQPIHLGQRLKKTSFVLAKNLALTGVFAFIPVLHFVLVPAGLLVTAVSTWFSWKRNYSFDQLEIHCPTCDQKSMSSLGGTELPLRTFCPSCRNMVYVNN
jgi:hypothetical protein